jgi:hypothetical protein
MPSDMIYLLVYVTFIVFNVNLYHQDLHCTSVSLDEEVDLLLINVK